MSHLCLTYDKLNRLTAQNSSLTGLISYTYDNAGNRTSKVASGSTTTYSYDNRNRLTETLDNGIITGYSYDNNGNQTAVTVNDKTTTYDYDGYNRLSGITSTDGTFAINYYDALGMRVSTVVDGTRQDYIFDRDSIIAKTNGRNELDNRYIRGIDLIAQQDGKGNSSYYLQNAHGDVTNIVKGNGAILNSYTYDAFGNILSQTEIVANIFKYSGEQYD